MRVGRTCEIVVLLLLGILSLTGCHESEEDLCEVSDTRVYVRDKDGSIFILLGEKSSVVYREFGLFEVKGAGYASDVRVRRESLHWIIFRDGGRFSVKTEDNECGIAIQSALASQAAYERIRPTQHI